MPLNYSPLYTSIWSDKNFKKLTVSARLLFIYLFANESVTLTGIYDLDLDVCKLKCKINGEFDVAFNEIITANLIKWDKDNEKIWIINRFKLMPNNRSPRITEGVVKELNIIDHPFKQDFIKKYSESLANFSILLDKKSGGINPLLNGEQVKSFAYDLKWDKSRVKKFYMDRHYPEQKIDEIIKQVLPQWTS